MDAIRVAKEQMRAPTATFFGALALACTALGTGTAYADAPCAGADAAPGTVADTVIQQAALCLLNQQRAAVGEVALVEQAQLDASSTAYSRLMVAEQFFAHVSPEGTTMTSRVSGTGYLGSGGAWILGENIAWGSGTLSTPANIVVAWMNSEEHRDNILDGRFREIGIGVATGAPVATSSPGATYTTDFGVRSGATAASAKGSGSSPTGTAASTSITATVPTDSVGQAARTTKPTTSGNATKPPAKKKAAAKKAARAKARASRARRASHEG